MIKTKFFLTLLTVNSLLLAANSAFADMKSPPTSNIEIARLSHSISTIIDLEGDTRSLVEMAIARALVAQNTDLPNNSGWTKTMGHRMTVPVPNSESKLPNDEQPNSPAVDKDKSTTDNPPTPTVMKDKNGNPIVERRRFVMGARGNLLPQQNSQKNS